MIVAFRFAEICSLRYTHCHCLSRGRRYVHTDRETVRQTHEAMKDITSGYCLCGQPSGQSVRLCTANTCQSLFAKVMMVRG